VAIGIQAKRRVVGRRFMVGGVRKVVKGMALEDRFPDRPPPTDGPERPGVHRRAPVASAWASSPLRRRSYAGVPQGRRRRPRTFHPSIRLQGDMESEPRDLYSSLGETADGHAEPRDRTLCSRPATAVAPRPSSHASRGGGIARFEPGSRLPSAGSAASAGSARVAFESVPRPHPVPPGPSIISPSGLSRRPRSPERPTT
jgi:hypothetical protein